MLHFSLCKIAQREPSRGGAGAWRRHVPSQAAPRHRRVRVQQESTWIRHEEQWPGRTCRPRTTRWRDGPASQARHLAVPSALRSKRGTTRSAGRHGASKRIIWLSGPADKDGGETRACPRGVPELSGVGGRRTAHLNRAGKRGSRQRRKQFEKGAAKETRTYTPAVPRSAWLSANAHNWLCFSARSQLGQDLRFTLKAARYPCVILRIDQRNK